MVLLAACGDLPSPALLPVQTFEIATQPIAFAPPAKPWEPERELSGGLRGVRYVKRGSVGEAIGIADSYDVSGRLRRAELAKLLATDSNSETFDYDHALRRTWARTDKPYSALETEVAQAINAALSRANRARKERDYVTVRSELLGAQAAAERLHFSMQEVIDRAVFRPEATIHASRDWGSVVVVTSAAALPATAFDLQGHRGARGLAPENTMAAFERALAIGVTTLETDLAVSKDGVLVISHDPHLNPDLVRGSDGAWLAAKGPTIHSLTFEELQRYDIGRSNPASNYAKGYPEQQPADGQRFPKLTDLFALGKDRAVRFNVETKITPTSGADTPDAETFAKLVVAAIREAGLTRRVTVQSFDWRTLVAVRKLAPDIATACLTIETPNNDTVQRQAPTASPWHAGLALADHGRSVPRLVRAAGCGTWSMFWRNLTPDAVAEAHALGLQVLPMDGERPGRHGTPRRLGRRRHHHGLSGPLANGARRQRQATAIARATCRR